MKDKKYFLFLLSILLIAVLSLLTESCADEPTSLGLSYVPPGISMGVKIFDSYVDTMAITVRNVKKRANTSGSAYLMVGNSGVYNSKALLKFLYLPATYDSGIVNSAKLTLYYKNYFYPVSQSDSLGQVGFDIYKVQQNLNLSTITLDSVNSTSFGTVSQGSYTGIPTDTAEAVTITLNPAMVQDWLYVAQDSSWANKNYGIALIPNGASNVIKGFYATQTNILRLKPSLQIIVTKNNKTDTITTQDAESVSLAEGTLQQQPGSFTLQSGIGYLETMRFDLSHIPSTATINDVLIYLTIDSINSKLSTGSSRSVNFAYISDTAGLQTSGLAFVSSVSGNQYVTRIMSLLQPCPFQRWLDGQTNYGMEIVPSNNNQNLDIYSFYNIDAQDPQKRPRVVIKYTPRATP